VRASVLKSDAMTSFGENLRRERELRGVALRDISEATKISVRFLEALEQDRIERLPGGIFPRAFLREYGRYLGLDVERLTVDFLFAHGQEIPEKLPPQSSRPKSRSSSSFWILAVVFVGGLLTLARTEFQPRPAPQPAAVAQPSLPAERPPTPTAPTPPSADLEGLVLNLSARQSCWVEAEVDGQKVLSRVLNAGDTEKLEATGEIVLSVGNAGGLAFSINDHPGVSLGRSGEVKRIVITKKNLPSLVEGTAAGSESS